MYLLLLLVFFDWLAVMEAEPATGCYLFMLSSFSSNRFFFMQSS
jgi:hypothetical protein